MKRGALTLLSAIAGSARKDRHGTCNCAAVVTVVAVFAISAKAARHTVLFKVDLFDTALLTIQL